LPGALERDGPFEYALHDDFFFEKVATTIDMDHPFLMWAYYRHKQGFEKAFESFERHGIVIKSWMRRFENCDFDIFWYWHLAVSYKQHQALSRYGESAAVKAERLEIERVMNECEGTLAWMQMPWFTFNHDHVHRADESSVQRVTNEINDVVDRARASAASVASGVVNS
jgi:hypothetical protein